LQPSSWPCDLEVPPGPKNITRFAAALLGMQQIDKAHYLTVNVILFKIFLLQKMRQKITVR
jgi:hypothetical protein